MCYVEAFLQLLLLHSLLAMASGGIEQTDTSDSDAGEAADKQPRFLLVVRHSERIDYEYGNQWISNVTERPDGTFSLALPFTDPIEYVSLDVPRRSGGLITFRGDTPITPNGHLLARQVGVNIKKHNIPISHIYSSPALRCVQTAAQILTGLDQQLPVHIEPGLFELLSLRPIPTFMTLEELQGHGLPVDMDYKVIWPASRFNPKEGRKELYERTHTVTQTILDRHQSEGGHILIVAHAASLDTCVRRLLGKQAPSNRDFYEALNSEYCEVKMIQEKMKVQNGRKAWHEAGFYLR